MKSVKNRNNAAYLLACSVGCLFVLAGCSSDDDSPIVDSSDPSATTVTVSGTVTDFNSAPLPGVAVEGVYTSPGDASNAMTTTDSTGTFSLTVNANTPFYLHGSISGYATLNSEKGALSASITNEDIEMPTETEAQSIINDAFPAELPQLSNHAWLAVDVYDTNDVELAGKTITSSVTPAGFAYIDCTGAPGATATVTCPDRDGAMYLAYFDSTTESTVTVDSENKIAPLNLGEITYLDYEFDAAVTPPPDDGPTAFDLGKDYYDANCAACHGAGSYDTTTSPGGDIASTSIPLNLSSLPGMSGVADIDTTIQTNLETFLFDASIQ